MTSRVYRLDTNFEIEVKDVREFLSEYDPPGEIEDTEIERRGNKLIINAVGVEDSGTSKYSPTARLKASVKERRMYETEDGWAREPPKKKTPGYAEETEESSELFEYACFRGDRETVLQNSDLQGPMFKVLRDLAKFSDNGKLTAIVGDDEGISATRVIEGDERDVSVEVVDESDTQAGENTSNWRNNKYISD